jgi:hypothetical protein
MTGKLGGPPKGKSWVWLTLEMVENGAWRSLTTNARRVIDFLMIEHMRHAGKENGALLAPRRQLVAFGIGTHFISEAIDEAVLMGFVDVKRGTGRRASTYALTWLPLRDGIDPTNRWRAVASAKEHSLEMSAKQHPLVVPNSTHKPHSECQTALAKPVVSAVSGSAKQHSPSRRRSLRRGNNTNLSKRDEAERGLGRDWLLVTDPEGAA